MKIYKVEIVTILVVAASSVDEAAKVAVERYFVNGAYSAVTQATEVRGIEELPRGWTGCNQAFSKYEQQFGFTQQSIRQILDGVTA